MSVFFLQENVIISPSDAPTRLAALISVIHKAMNR